MNIALVHNWPGARNAELDLIGRMQRVLAGNGHTPVIIDPLGNPLDASGKPADGAVQLDAAGFDFCLNLHYSNPHFLDCFSYAVNWNPVAYLLRDPSHGTPVPHQDLVYLAACLASHDVLLSAGSADTDQLVSALAERPNPAVMFPDLALHTSCQWEQEIARVSLDGFRVFYIGVNWERIADNSSSDKRHGGLLERLDATGRVDFYGVKRICGIEPWQGFHHYKGELPFDNGLSIIRTANQCGVSLVLSSPQHRESGLVSMRIFQACAARSVIISDDNPFIVEHFGDAVLIFEYSSDARIACERISALIEWIEQHPRQAIEKAERAHLIFAQRFSLDRELDRLLNRHSQTLDSVRGQTLPADRGQTVDVVFRLVIIEQSEVDRFIDNLNRQLDVVSHGIVCCPQALVAPLTERLEQQARFQYTLVPMSESEPKTGAAVLLAVTEHAKGETFCIHQAGTRWHRHHLALLLRVLQNGGTLVSQSHVFIRNQAIRSHAYNRSLASLAIGGELTLLRPDHLAAVRIDAFSPAAFLFHRKLLINEFERAQDIALFDAGAAFFLLTLNYIAHGTLPAGTSRISFSRERDDDLFALHDMDDAAFVGRLQVEAVLLGTLFRQRPAARELAAIAATHGGDTLVPGITSEGGGLYAYLVKTLRNRPMLKRLSVAVYNAVRLVLRLPPNPPRIPTRKAH